ncbi:transcriptional activator hac1 [Sarocladium implicatum]|nr:transcriptional activator hac1 [Sarocladium implicatum]
MDPTEMLTPKSDRLETPCDDMKDDDNVEDSPSSPSSEKKTKKRKSWGQVLPEPKTNLPPRKRAKTEDEKEQRRVERVLRNRRAAQSSRERKRLEVEALEKRNEELEAMLRDAQKTNLMMFQQLQALRQDSGLSTAANPLLDSSRDSTIALSQELFSSQDGNATVNPASLSPDLEPVPDASEPPKAAETETEAPSAPFPDVTQHPAEVLSDLPCHMLAEVMPYDFKFSLGDSVSMPTAADADRYVLESGLLASPDSSTLDDDHLVGDSAPSFFDINDFITDEAGFAASELMAASDSSAADHWLGQQVYDFETQVSSENPIQQPQSGASSFGCDDGGIAVGV